jgi:hypothetical protein
LHLASQYLSPYRYAVTILKPCWWIILLCMT